MSFSPDVTNLTKRTWYILFKFNTLVYYAFIRIKQNKKLKLKDVKNELTKAQTKYKTQYENEKKMYQKMIGGVSPNNKKEKLNKKESKSKNESSSYLTYVVAGIAVAALSIGFTMLAKYKNVF